MFELLPAIERFHQYALIRGGMEENVPGLEEMLELARDALEWWDDIGFREAATAALAWWDGDDLDLSPDDVTRLLQKLARAAEGAELRGIFDKPTMSARPS